MSSNENLKKPVFDLSELVDRYYEMNPETEDVMPSGHDLEDGMRVLIEDPGQRSDLDHLRFFIENNESYKGNLSNARQMNRWSVVSDINVWDDETVTFIGIYDDGVKRQHRQPVEMAWIVKKDSIDQSLGGLAETLGYSDEDALKIGIQRVAGRYNDDDAVKTTAQPPVYLMDPHKDDGVTP